MSVTNSVGGLLMSGMVPGEDKITLLTPRLSVTIEKTAASALTGTVIEQARGSFTFPPWCEMAQDPDNCDPEQEIAVMVRLSGKYSVTSLIFTHRIVALVDLWSLLFVYFLVIGFVYALFVPVSVRSSQYLSSYW